MEFFGINLWEKIKLFENEIIESLEKTYISFFNISAEEEKENLFYIQKYYPWANHTKLYFGLLLNEEKIWNENYSAINFTSNLLQIEDFGYITEEQYFKGNNGLLTTTLLFFCNSVFFLLLFLVHRYFSCDSWQISTPENGLTCMSRDNSIMQPYMFNVASPTECEELCSSKIRYLFFCFSLKIMHSVSSLLQNNLDGFQSLVYIYR